MIDENQVLVEKSGAIEAVVAVMRAHVASADVSEAACRAFINICCNHGSFLFDYDRCCHGCPSIAALCRRLRSCLWAGENQAMAGKSGAVDALVAAMRAHVDDAGVSENACWALFNICASNGALWLLASSVCIPVE